MENIQDIYPLSPMQQGMLFHTLYAPESGNYTEQMSAVFNGTLNTGAFKNAWQAVLNRHDVLRTAFVWEDVEEPLQVVHENLELPFELLDWSDRDTEAQNRALDDLRLRERDRGFELTDAPLLRIILIRLSPEAHAFIFTYHHILLDGWAMPLVLGEVFQLYDRLDKGLAPDLPPTLPFKNYIAWLQEQDKDQAASFWRERLQGFYSPTALVVDRNMPQENQPYLKKRYTLSPESSDKLHTLAREMRITLNTIMQGAWALVQAIYNRSDDVVFGATVSGRPAEIPGIETMVGLFINTLPVRARINYADSLQNFLKQLHAEQNEARAWEFTPLVEIQKASELSADQPLFETLFVFENYPVGETMQQQKSDLSVSDVRMIERSNYPLTIVAAPGNPIAMEMAFDSGRLPETAVDRLAGHMLRVLELMAGNPQLLLRDISLLTPAESKQVLTAWNDTARDFPLDQSVVSLFEAIVEQYPDHTAVVHHEQKLDYRTLNARANRWARVLQSHGVQRGDYVALCLPRSPEMIIATLAILKCAAAYVPIDADYPAERINYMLKDAGIQVLITDAVLMDKIDTASLRTLFPEELNGAEQDESNLNLKIESPETAYIIYTSGSTGKPKGVLLHHQGLINTIYAQQLDFRITPESRGLQFASYSFDAAVSEVFSALLSGAALYIIEKETILSRDEFIAFLNGHRISYVTLPPSLLTLLTDAELPHLETVISVGEACPVPLARQWMKRCRFFNGYGPTEATIGCVWGQVESLSDETHTAPIGKPIYNDRIYIVDPFMHPQPVGVPGELCIESPGLAYGYLHRSELTAERFVANPFSADGDSRLYLSGDLARWLDDGTIEFIGRIDFQVKIRGNRIELGEIEAALLREKSVKEAVVRAVGTDPQSLRLAAYVVPATDDFDVDKLRNDLRERLPEYMQPASFTLMDAFPLTHNGKVNRRALPEPDFEQAGTATDTTAATPVQELLLALWRDVLNMENISVNDNFFHIGGHSLLATQLVSRIRDAFDVEIPLRRLFEQPTIAWLARLIEEEMNSEKGYTLPPLKAMDRPAEIPLSFAQQRLWFLDQLQPGGTFYNIPAAFAIKGPLNVDALEKALAAIVRRHEVLRTTFADNGGKPVQVIHDQAPLPFSVEDHSALSPEERDEKISRAVQAAARQVFDLARGPLWHSCLHVLNPGSHIFTLTLHHTIADGWSMGVFISEMAELYRAFSEQKTAQLPPLEVQYADYALWQQQWLQGEVLERQIDFWRSSLGNNPPVLELPYDFPRPAVQTFNGAAVQQTLSPELSARIREESAALGVTPFMFMLAAFQTLLHRYSRQDEIIVGSPIANRNHSGTEKLIGFFVNNLILKSDFSGQPDFETLVLEVRDFMLEAYAHQDVPFEQIVDALVTRRDTSRSPIFQVMFVYQNLPQSAVEVSGIQLEALEHTSHTAKFDLSVTVSPGESMAWQFEYNSDLFREETIRRMMGHFENILHTVLEDIEVPVDEAEYLDEEEKKRLLRDGNQTETEFGGPHTVPGKFEDMAQRHPGEPALIFQSAPGRESVILSYEQLNRAANRLAHMLLQDGVRREEIIGISVERGPEMIIAMLGILKSGAAYLPIDPQYPRERIAYMIGDSGLQKIVTSEKLSALFTHERVETITVDRSEAFAGFSEESPRVSLHADNLAYVIYTSGSSGRPKGTLLHHGGACNLAALQQQAFETGPGSRILQFASLSFDAATWEFLMALLSGSALVLTSKETIADAEALTTLLEEQKVTTITLPPSVLAVWPDKQLPDLTTIITAGEAVPGPLVNKWSRDRLFFNAYGPTETTVCATMHRCEGNYSSTPPIGMANANFKTYVLDDKLNPVATGVPGELCVSGTGVARGYHNRPELTVEKFVPHPYADNPGERLYRTGDLVRRRPDGQLEFLGRIDDQVKVRGFRIELGEIEAVMSQSPLVRDQFVTVWPDAGGENRLVAYWVAAEKENSDPAPVIAHLKKHLPDYMVPADFMLLESMPLTPNGKVDRKALPLPQRDRATLTVEYMAPRNEIEETLVTIVAALLHHEKVGVFDNFFDLGGHSLLATQFMSRIRETFDIELPLLTLFEKPTVAELADAVEVAKASGIKAKPKIEKVERGPRAAKRPARRSRKS
ncbi:MAG TPA: amino acid adenylation domain-containing protein [Caldithrix abyssi]|uniref:Amino acid adenylation domain-containing protein n=1 Tax=Caldithrix abyssi TaxID=187145 RepID=A0A7V1PUU7_CALAY|nr:amino acid adenylation domain-containing protein [Caldithrix abyssi]